MQFRRSVESVWVSLLQCVGWSSWRVNAFHITSSLWRQSTEYAHPPSSICRLFLHYHKGIWQIFFLNTSHGTPTRGANKAHAYEKLYNRALHCEKERDQTISTIPWKSWPNSGYDGGWSWQRMLLSVLFHFHKWAINRDSSTTMKNVVLIRHGSAIIMHSTDWKIKTCFFPASMSIKYSVSPLSTTSWHFKWSMRSLEIARHFGT